MIIFSNAFKTITFILWSVYFRPSKLMFVSSFKTKERYKLEALKKKQEQEEERMKKVEEEKRRKQDELKKSVPQSRITL